MENSGTFTFYHTFGVKNMIRQSHRQTEWADSHKQKNQDFSLFKSAQCELA